MRAAKWLASSRDILPPLAQRRPVQGDDAQTVEEILAEGPFADRLFEVPVGGGHHPHVDADGAGAAHALEFPLLEEAQELGLERQR